MKDPEWVYGFCLLGAWVLIILSISFGKVFKESSFGLDQCIVALSFLSGQWANKKFGGQK